MNETNASSNVAIEKQWMEWLASQAEWRPAVKCFCAHYHYFSLNQVVAFSGLFNVVPKTDRRSLSLLAEVLFEELGCGNPSNVHSILFERFARACGVEVSDLPISDAAVANGVRWYVGELRAAFGGSSLARALATYQFLESSAVETYGPLLRILQGFGFSEEALEFFKIHATIEIEHAKAAQDMVDRANFMGSDLADFEDQKRILAKAWHMFWLDLWEMCKASSR